MKKIAFGILVFAAFAMLAVPAGAQEVYFVPQHSSADYCNTTDVEIWVNATGLKSGQINLTYDPTCANVTNYVKNATNFPSNLWTHHYGSEWITFMTSEPSLSGNYEIGTLTIHCVNAEDCTTPLEFNMDDPDAYCALFDSYAGEISSVTWKDGTFTCGAPTTLDLFDTETGTYPSISGTHTGTITPDSDITVNNLYTYPCTGTGGHTEYVHIYGTGIDESASWTGYSGDWHNISFSEITLEAGKIYNYEIRTGSYPQIIHATSKSVTGGTINCTSFVDANGKTYNDWIPGIRLYKK